ncbi:DUF4064 domain-containing protein [Lentibacillus saliphilus]|uniref:DUF4064 domain-containing protein n=1 Tax=Lentibacillus saliphilus TaxID=2737028 RepID=UPI001C300E90|nr:DUF4064 domain-containing protein [Lentibacillus saliphilus]
MKRTGEVILGIVGAVIYAGLAVVGIFLKFLLDDEEIKGQFTSDMINEDPTLSSEDVNIIIDMASNLGWYIVIVSIIAIILGVISMILLKGNNKPKVAGIILIITAVISTVITAGMALFCGLFYLIAGIMALVRKPPQVIEG